MPQKEAASSTKRPKETLCNSTDVQNLLLGFYLSRRARLRRKLVRLQNDLVEGTVLCRVHYAPQSFLSSIVGLFGASSTLCNLRHSGRKLVVICYSGYSGVAA
jgi:hypothetical protein